jgi:hypothetical protein
MSPGEVTKSCNAAQVLLLRAVASTTVKADLPFTALLKINENRYRTGG